MDYDDYAPYRPTPAEEAEMYPTTRVEPTYIPDEWTDELPAVPRRSYTDELASYYLDQYQDDEDDAEVVAVTPAPAKVTVSTVTDSAFTPAVYDHSPEAIERAITIYTQEGQTDLRFAHIWQVVEGGRWRFTRSRGKLASAYVYDGARWALSYPERLAASVTAVAAFIRATFLTAIGEAAYGPALAQAKLDVMAAKAQVAAGKRAAAVARMAEADPESIAQAAVEAARSGVVAWAERYESARGISDAVRVIQTLTDQVVAPSVWDTDRHLLNTPHGVVGLRTGERLPHDPSHMMTRMTRHSPWDADGTLLPDHSQIARIIEGMARSSWHVAEDEDDKSDTQEVRDEKTAALAVCLQRFAGCVSSGHTPRAFLYVHGESGVGKSLLWKNLARALGVGEDGTPGYATLLPASMLTEPRFSGGDGPTPKKLELRGARFAYVDEAKDIALDGELMKEISDSSSITARTHGGEHETWANSATAVICANTESARWRSGDRGMEGRAFPLTLTEASLPQGGQDGSLADWCASPEGQSHLLAWAIRGAQAFIADGGTADALRAPEYVMKCRGRTIADLDPVARFWEEAIEELKTPRTAASPVHTTHGDLYAAYAKWALARGVKMPLTDRALRAALPRDADRKSLLAERYRAGDAPTKKGDPDKRRTAYARIAIVKKWQENF